MLDRTPRSGVVVRALALFSLAAAALVPTTAPARAAATPAPPVVTDLATTPGHVTGTVTSDQPYVFVRMRGNVPGTLVPTSGGTGTFDLETWGYSSRDQLSVAACSELGDRPVCSEAVGYDIAVKQVTPQLTWLTDGTVGPADAVRVSVDDAGGGVLRAIFVPQYLPPRVEVTLDPHGTTTIPVMEGPGEVVVKRCDPRNLYNCTTEFDSDLSFPLEVRRRLSPEVTGDYLIRQGRTTVTRTIATGAHGAYRLSYGVRRADDPAAAVQPVGAAEGDLDASGATTFEVSSTDLPGDGAYDIVGSITVVDPDFGTYRDVPLQGAVRRDLTVPAVPTVAASAAILYPAVATERYPRSVTFDVRGQLDEVAMDNVARIRDAAGRAVARADVAYVSPTEARATWDARTDDGEDAAAGDYTIELTEPGAAAPIVGHVRVSGQRLVERTITLAPTARGTRIRTTAGRCTVLTRPAGRSWSNGLGLYARYSGRTPRSCAGAASTITTQHALRLPAADHYVGVRVEVVGGASRTRSSSTAIARYRTASARPGVGARLTRTLGRHPLPGVAAASVVRSGGYLVWDVTAAGGSRYDVAGFRVTLRYVVLG